GLLERAARHGERRTGGSQVRSSPVRVGAVSFDIAVSGPAAEAVSRVVPQLVTDLVASRITAQDSSLWGEAAEEEASKRLGWTEAVVVSEGLVDDILALRDDLRESGIDHVVLAGMGGSSLA